MPLTEAKQAEIIRSNQKDDYYSRYIRGSLSDIAQSLFGPRWWMLWRKEVDLVADLGYFVLTTISGFQTLGEEYVSILQVDGTKRRIPSVLSRVAQVLLYVGTPYLLDKLLVKLERELRQNPNLTLDPEVRTRLIDMVPLVRHVITIAHRCHLAVFYLRGVYYHIAKRLTQTHYLLVRPMEGAVQRPNYKILGWLAAIQLSLTFAQQIYKLLQQRRKNLASSGTYGFASAVGSSSAPASSDEQALTNPANKCALCLEVRQHSTATPCGHLFCWGCIHEWCSNKAECPLCREKFGPSRLIFLQNYDPT